MNDLLLFHAHLLTLLVVAVLAATLLRSSVRLRAETSVRVHRTFGARDDFRRPTLPPALPERGERRTGRE